jgi:hypothetical protein
LIDAERMAVVRKTVLSNTGILVGITVETIAAGLHTGAKLKTQLNTALIDLAITVALAFRFRTFA